MEYTPEKNNPHFNFTYLFLLHVYSRRKENITSQKIVSEPERTSVVHPVTNYLDVVYDIPNPVSNIFCTEINENPYIRPVSSPKNDVVVKTKNMSCSESRQDNINRSTVMEIPKLNTDCEYKSLNFSLRRPTVDDSVIVYDKVRPRVFDVKEGAIFIGPEYDSVENIKKILSADKQGL